MVKALEVKEDTRLTTQGAYESSADDYAFVQKVQKWWDEADKEARNWLEEERKEHAFAMGHQWDDKDYKLLQETGRYPLVLNKTLAHLLVVSGYERTNRMRVKYLPVAPDDVGRAEVWTEVVRDIQEKGDIDWNKSDAFLDMLKGGRGFLHLRISYDDVPSGEVKSTVVPPWEIRIDPTAKSYDLADARYVIWTKQVSLEELLVLWPEKADELLRAQTLAAGKTSVQHDFASLDDYDLLVMRAYNKLLKRWDLREVWYWQVEKDSEFMVQDPLTGSWNPVETEPEIKAMLLEFPDLQWRREARYSRKYYQAFIVGPVLLEHNPSYMEYQGYPFVPFYGLYDSEENRYVGLTRHVMDAQIELNKRRTQVLHILNRSAKSGWIGPEGSFIDRDRWEMESAIPGVVLEYRVDPGLPPPTEIKPDTFPAAVMQLEQMATNDIREISGVNINLMGMDTAATVTGILDRQRKQASLTNLQIYYDHMRRSTKILGKILLSLAQQFYTDGRQFVISGKQVVLDENYRAGRYDLIVEESPYSPNQKLETAAKLREVIDISLKMGIPIPPDVLDYADLPESLVEKWKDLLNQVRQEKADPKIELEKARLQLELREQIRKEVETHFKNLLNLAKAEAAEKGTQLDVYQALISRLENSAAQAVGLGGQNVPV